MTKRAAEALSLEEQNACPSRVPSSRGETARVIRSVASGWAGGWCGGVYLLRHTPGTRFYRGLKDLYAVATLFIGPGDQVVLDLAEGTITLTAKRERLRRLRGKYAHLEGSMAEELHRERREQAEAKGW